MADLAQLPSVKEQLRLIAGLRWSLLRNHLQRRNNRWDLVGIVFAAISSSVLVLGLCAAFYAGTYAFLVKGKPGWTAMLFWAIFFWWQVVPIFVAGFGANFEFRNLLRFPLSLRTFYILGLGYGFADFAAVSSLCWIAAMLAAVATVRPQLLPVAMLVSLLFVLLNVTLERLIASWLEKLLAKRRVRELMVGLFLLCMVSLNFLSPALQIWGKGDAQPSIARLRSLPFLVARFAHRRSFCRCCRSESGEAASRRERAVALGCSHQRSALAALSHPIPRGRTERRDSSGIEQAR